MKKLLFILLVVFIGCSSTAGGAGSADETNKIKTFWEYVSKNEKRLFDGDSNDQAIVEELNAQIRLVDENLGVLVGNDIIDKKKELVISSIANPDYFGLCDRIVKRAPNFASIKPVSLMPPTDNISKYRIGNLVLSAEDIQVHVDSDGDLLFILSDNHLAQIKSDNTGEIYSNYMQALYLMTLQLLGERTFGNKRITVNVLTLPIIMTSVPFMELRKEIASS